MSLKNLAKLFGEDRLYIVGGYVRNMLMGVPASDIDIASPKRAEDVISLLSKSDFKVEPSSLRMGTLIIRDGKEKYEYTAFRQDSYPDGSGKHRPLNVKFGCSIEEDARRRDFTVNAIYYDILSDEYIDPLGGIEDVKERVLKTTREAHEVFSEDGLRLMRLARFHAETGFSIEKNTFETARKLSYLINDISVERIADELKRILVADTKPYGNKKGHIQGVEMLISLGIMGHIIPELMRGEGVEQNENYHCYDVLSHAIHTMEYAEPSIRLVALLHDVGKPYALERDGNMYLHAVIGSEIAKTIAMRLRLSKREIHDTERLIAIHMFNLDGKAKKNTVRKFILENADIIKDFFNLRRADITASKNADFTSLESMEKEYTNMIESRVPLRISELDVSGSDLIEIGIAGREIGESLDMLLEKVVIGNVLNEREKLIEYVKKSRNYRKLISKEEKV